MERYSRQARYKNIGRKGQQQLSSKEVAIIGIGALGTVISELLARAGIGKLLLIDRDFIELSNLQRQSLFDEEDIGQLKPEAAKKKLEKINSGIKIASLVLDVDSTNISELKTPDLIIGCTDNIETRFLINDYSLKKRIPWIYASAIADTGHVFDVIPGGACIRCIFKGRPDETCDTVGILNSNSHMISSIAANEAIKILLGKEYEKNLLHLDIWCNELTKITVKKDDRCPACNGNYEYLDGERIVNSVKMCGKGSYLIKGKKINLNEMKKIFGKEARLFSGVLHFKNITLFEDGRAMIKAASGKEAKKIYGMYLGN